MENSPSPGVEMLQSPVSVVISLLGGLLLFVLVLLLAWFCTRWLGGYYRARGGQAGTVQVLERTVIGPDRTLMVVRAGERVWLLGVTPQNITPIGELSPDAYPEEAAPEALPGPMEFSAALRDAVQKWAPGRKQEERGNKDE